MKRILLLLCTLMLIASGAVSRAQESGIGPGVQFRRYTVKDDEFSVVLPLYPTMTTNKGVRKSDGKSRLERRLKIPSRSLFYSIDSFENPEPRQSLEEFIEEQGLGSPFDPGTKRNVTVDGLAGIEYSSSNVDAPSVVQIFSTEKHIYRFALGGPGVVLAEKEFFSSIKLGGKPEGIAVSDSNKTPIDSDIGEVYTGKEVDVKARLLAKPEARYTDEARKYEVSGVVILKALFARDGTVVKISVVSGLPFGLTEQAIAAARKIKFTPAMKEGKPVSMWMQLEYRFNP
jgi:TonB family protein